MNFNYIDLNSQSDLIDGVIIKKLNMHKDPSGTLVETLRDEWKEVINDNMPFKMQYVSQTPPGIARDEDKWHVHKFQKDRFICLYGKIVTAIYDPREESNTKDKLNLFVMSPSKDEEMYLLVIPENTYHGFISIDKKTPAFLANFPTQIYNPEDEGRIDHAGELDWNKVREDFDIK